MKEKRAAYILIAVLCVGAVLGSVLRTRLLRNRADLRGEDVWVIRYDLMFDKVGKGSFIRIGIPDTASGARVFRETFEYSGMVMDILRSRRTRCREAVCVKRGDDTSYRFQGEFEIMLDINQPFDYEQNETVPLSTADRAFYLNSEETFPDGRDPIRDLLSMIRKGKPSKNEMVDRIHQFCTDELIHDELVTYSDAGRTLQDMRGNPAGIARTMTALCRGALIPSRVVTGFVLNRNSEGIPHVWVEVYIKKSWIPFDPVYGFSGSLPPGYIPVRKESPSVVKVSEGVGIREVYSVHPPSSLGKPGETGKTPSDILIISRLSAGMKRTLALLMLLTVGALVTSVFRNIIGTPTFGTFSPALLALSFVFKNFQAGLLIFLMIFIIGLVGRLAVEKLKLLMVPRLGAILTLVVLCLVFTVSILDYFNITPSAHTVLFPTVIFTMLIERFYIRWEEKGFGYSIKVLGGTFLNAGICLILFKIKALQEFLIRYPEVLLICMALFVLMGRYSGYRLSELGRFRAFSRGDDER